MTGKCCRECVHLGKINISRTGRICTGMPITASLEAFKPVIRESAIDTFYCQAFHPRRNSAKPVGQTEDTDKCQCNGDFTDGTPFCQQCGKKREVIPPIQRRFA